MSGVITNLEGITIQEDGIDFTSSPTVFNFDSDYFVLGDVVDGVLPITGVKRPTVFSWTNTLTYSPGTYYQIFNDQTLNTVVTNARAFIGAGTFRNFKIAVLPSGTGTGAVTCTWMKNEGETAMLKTITGLSPTVWATSAADVPELTFTTDSDDYVCVKTVLTTLSLVKLNFYVEFVPE